MVSWRGVLGVNGCLLEPLLGAEQRCSVSSGVDVDVGGIAGTGCLPGSACWTGSPASCTSGRLMQAPIARRAFESRPLRHEADPKAAKRL